MALFFLIAIRVARRGARRPLALVTMLAVATALFITELKQLGLPDIWFPFTIGVTLTQYAYALTVLLLPFLLLTPAPGTTVRAAAAIRPTTTRGDASR